ncbi:phage baseplate assembly protein V [Leptolyngbya sp. AN02str]|uniref:phage baseplate assembly protein V n=1 Tax=Leptolyngbya sp. AN02str TaxID=3423363 RepID=UPI003D31852B
MLKSQGSNSKGSQSSKGQSSLHFGEVTAVNEATGEAKVQLPDLGIESYWLKVLVRRSTADRHADWLDVGDRVAVLLDEKGEAGVILGSVYTESNPPPISTKDKWYRQFSDGSFIEFDRSAGRLKISCDTVEIVCSNRVEIVSSAPSVLQGKEIVVVGGTDNDNPDTIILSGQ